MRNAAIASGGRGGEANATHEYFLMPSRMFGCSSTLTLSNSAPAAERLTRVARHLSRARRDQTSKSLLLNASPVTSRMRMTWELNQHMGEAGVPFM